MWCGRVTGVGQINAVSVDGKVRPVWTSPLASLEDLSRDGRVLLTESTARRELVGFGRDGAPHNLTALNWSFPSDISADGNTVLFYEQIRQPPGVYVRKLDGSPAVRLADGEGYGFSPDGRFALTVKLPERRPIILVPTGAGESKTLDVGNITFAWANWFPDGKRILVNGREGGKGGARLFVLDVSGGAPKPISPEGVSIVAQSISPDGRSIVARGPDGRVAIYPAEGGGQPRPVPGVEPEEIPLRWTSDGRSIYVSRLSALPGVIDLVDIATGTPDEVEGIPARRRERRRAGRPRDDLARRHDLRVFVPARARGPLPRDRNALTSLRLLRGLRPAGAPACGSRGCALDRKPGLLAALRSRGANLLPPFGRETIRAAST